jgi:hypothetical protein
MPSPRGCPPTSTSAPVCLREKLKSSRFSRRQRFQADPSARKQKKFFSFSPQPASSGLMAGKNSERIPASEGKEKSDFIKQGVQ